MIKLFGYLLMTIGLIGGSLAAITAYRPKLSLPDSQLVGLTLTAGAGQQAGDPRAPLVARGTVLSAENLAALRAAEKVRTPAPTTSARLVVKEFAFKRWDMAWAAGASVGVLLLGASIVKLETKRQIRAAGAKTGSDAGAKGPTPEAALATIRTTLDALKRELGAMSDPAQKNARILQVIGDLNALEVAAIVDQRTSILGRLGMGGLASFMDRFASGERAISRAWSAAADGYIEEAEVCLDRAIAVMPEAQEKLRR